MNRLVLVVVVVVFFSFNSISQRFGKIIEKDSIIIDFRNELSELFYNWIENDQKLTSKMRSRINGGFVESLENPTSRDPLLAFKHHGVKFKISFTKVRSKLYTKISDTIPLNHIFFKLKSYNDYDKEGEYQISFPIKHCYLLNYNYKRAKYLIELNDEFYHMKIIRQNKRKLTMRMLKKTDIPLNYLDIFLTSINVFKYPNKEEFVTIYSISLNDENLFKSCCSTTPNDRE